MSKCACRVGETFSNTVLNLRLESKVGGKVCHREGTAWANMRKTQMPNELRSCMWFTISREQVVRLAVVERDCTQRKKVARVLERMRKH